MFSSRSMNYRFFVAYILILILSSVIMLVTMNAVMTKDSFFHLPLKWSNVFRILFLVGVSSELVNFGGFLCYPFRKSKTLMKFQVPEDYFLTIHFVSKGDNVCVLLASVKKALVLSEKVIKSNFVIRIVSEIDISHYFLPEERCKLQFIVVPRTYVSKNETLFKARALEYSRQFENNAGVGRREWVLYLDEESTITSSALEGSLCFMKQDRKLDKIGQGLITYTKGGFPKFTLMRALDCIRVGGDVGKHFLQNHIIKKILFGFHGSFFIASKELIDKVTFDVGPDSSFAEDISFAAKASDLGYQLEWVEGVVREQSPETFFDMLRQRSRWARGVFAYLMDKKRRLSSRISVASFSVGYKLLSTSTFLGLLIGYDEFGYFGFIYALLFSLKPSLLFGLLLSFKAVGSTKLNLLKFSALSLIFSPLFVLVDLIVLLYSFLSSEKDFYVVNKSASPSEMIYNAKI